MGRNEMNLVGLFYLILAIIAYILIEDKIFAGSAFIVSTIWNAAAEIKEK